MVGVQHDAVLLAAAKLDLSVAHLVWLDQKLVGGAAHDFFLVIVLRTDPHEQVALRVLELSLSALVEALLLDTHAHWILVVHHLVST